MMNGQNKSQGVFIFDDKVRNYLSPIFLSMIHIYFFYLYLVLTIIVCRGPATEVSFSLGTKETKVVFCNYTMFLELCSLA